MARKTVVRQRDIIISASVAALIIAGSLLFYIVFIAPTNSLAKFEQNKVSKAVSELAEKTRLAREAAQAKRENSDMRARLAAFDGRVLRKSQVPGLFAEVLRLADQAQLKIFHTRPLAPVVVGQGLRKFPYEIELRGTYHDVGRFVAGVESHASFLQVNQLDLSSVEGGTIRARVLVCLYGADEGWAARPRRGAGAVPEVEDLDDADQPAGAGDPAGPPAPSDKPAPSAAAPVSAS